MRRAVARGFAGTMGGRLVSGGLGAAAEEAFQPAEKAGRLSLQRHFGRGGVKLGRAGLGFRGAGVGPVATGFGPLGLLGPEDLAGVTTLAVAARVALALTRLAGFVPRGGGGGSAGRLPAVRGAGGLLGREDVETRGGVRRGCARTGGHGRGRRHNGCGSADGNRGRGGGGGPRGRELRAGRPGGWQAR